MGTTYARSQLFRLFYPAKDEASWLHTPFQPLESYPNTHIPASSPYKYTWPTSFRTAISFTCTFGKIQHTPKRRLGNSSRFKTATFMPLTLLTGILTSCSKKRWSTKGCFHIRWQDTLIQLQGVEKEHEDVRVVFKYCFLIYAELQIFRIAPQYSGLGPDTSSLTWTLLAPRQPKNAGGPCCRPPVPASPLPLGQHWPANSALHTAAKVMSIGWTKTPKVRKIFLSSLIQEKRKWNFLGQSTVTCTALLARQQP